MLIEPEKLIGIGLKHSFSRGIAESGIILFSKLEKVNRLFQGFIAGLKKIDLRIFT